MSRWAPGAQGRIERAALELFAERGYAETTIPQIVARAGLAKRTFFRYFPDKREVLFAGEGTLPAQVDELLDAAAGDGLSLEVVSRLLSSAVVGAFKERSIDYLRRRRSVIDAEPALRERELSKFSAMLDALSEGLRQRGVDDLSAQLTAELTVTAFRVGAARWVESPTTSDLPTVIHETLTAMRTLTTPTPG